MEDSRCFNIGKWLRQKQKYPSLIIIIIICLHNEALASAAAVVADEPHVCELHVGGTVDKPPVAIISV